MSESSEQGRVTQVERDGLVLDVLDEGPPDGEPVVLLHGFPERATSWRHVAPILNAAGYRTLAMDQRGYAPGARPKRRRDYRMPELVGDVKALIDRVGGSAHLVGHDWGAAAAWSTAMEHPDAVRTLTAVSVPHPAPFVQSLVRSTQGLKSWYMGLFQLPVLPEVLGRRFLDRFMQQGGMTEEEAERVRTEIIDDGALPTALNWYRGLPLNDPRASRVRVTVPTTLVWSTGDVALGRWAVDRTEKWVDAPYRLVVLEGATHWIPTQEPDALAAAVLTRIEG
jgi:pimeloyl-ACP methyl ester carboxylesterase